MIDGAKRMAGGKAGLIERGALILLALPIAAFTLFVGYNKALAPMQVLVEHLAWTTHLPEPLGRAIGWVEVATSLVLLLSIVLPRLKRAGLLAAAVIAFNHSVAVLVHIGAAEWSTLGQSAVLVPLCLVLVCLCRRRAAAV